MIMIEKPGSSLDEALIAPRTKTTVSVTYSVKVRIYDNNWSKDFQSIVGKEERKMGLGCQDSTFLS